MRRTEERLPAVIPLRIVRGKDAAWVKTVDVSKRALFVKNELPLEVRSLVQLRFDACGREIDAWGMVVRHGLCRGVRGTALSFHARCEVMKEIWDRFILELSQSYRETNEMKNDEIDATYVVRPRGVDRLATFTLQHLEQELPYRILTSVTRAEGTEVTLRIEHPKSARSFDLSAVVVRAWHENPRGMEVSIDRLEKSDLLRFRSFVETGLLELPEWVMTGPAQYAV